MKNTQPTGEVNGISLGVHKVTDTKTTDDYLAKRFTHWNISGPPGYKPHVRELPPIYTKEELAELRPKAQVTDRQIDGFRKCATGIMDRYFPLLQGETVVEDLHTFTKEPYSSHPAGTAVVIRRTNKATFFFVDPSVQVQSVGSVVTNIHSSPRPTQMLFAAPSPFAAAHVRGSGIEEAKIATKILSQFSVLLPGPAGTAFKFGMELVNMILGMAGSSGPNWNEIKEMMRQVVREELITNDLEYIQADYESIMKWGTIQYLPNRDHKPKDELWNMLRPQIDTVSHDINVLLQHNHRIPGFGLLLLGVDLYLALLQEQMWLDYSVDIKKAGDEWATSMLEVWKEVQKDRHDQITVTQYSYGVYAAGDVMTCYFWQWADKKTGETHGTRSGPWQAGGKHDNSEAGCRGSAEYHYQNVVLPGMIKTFGDPEKTAKAWRAVKVPQIEEVHALVT
jgi:hypothetical protein